MPVKYVERKYEVGQKYLVNEPLAKHFGKNITISKVEIEYFSSGTDADVYYTVEGNEYEEFGFQVHSIFEQGLKVIPEWVN